MLPQTLTIICANVGIGCLAYTYYLLRSFKQRVDRQTDEEMSKNLLEKEVTEFVQRVRKKEVTFEMIRDFYERFENANESARRLRRAWFFNILSGVFFIMTSIFGNLDFAVFVDFSAYYMLAIAVTFFAIAFRDILYLGQNVD